MVTYWFPELAYFMGWMLTILIFNFRGGNINHHFDSHLHVALKMHKHTLNVSEWESDSSQRIRHFSFYMMCWGIFFSNATSGLQISRNWLLLDHFPFSLGSPSEKRYISQYPRGGVKLITQNRNELTLGDEDSVAENRVRVAADGSRWRSDAQIKSSSSQFAFIFP